MNNNSNGPWWKEGVRIMSQVSTWIIVPIILALVVGKALDKHFGTDPWIFLSLAVLGFTFSCYGIIKVVRQYLEEIKKIGGENDNLHKE